jgi:hypothetical protein
VIAMPPIVASADADIFVFDRPVHAIVERTSHGLRVRLVGRSDRAVTIRYRLITTGGGNHATQGGSARLDPAHPVTLLDLTQSIDEDWAGVLDVTMDGGGGYRELLRMPALDSARSGR